MNCTDFLRFTSQIWIRSADALETLSTILKEVRPQCYIAVSVELLRELAEVYELMGINLKRMYKMHDINENQETIRRRMEGVYDIQTKLEKIGNMFGHNLDDNAEGSLKKEMDPAGQETANLETGVKSSAAVVPSVVENAC